MKHRQTVCKVNTNNVNSCNKTSYILAKRYSKVSVLCKHIEIILVLCQEKWNRNL